VEQRDEAEQAKPDVLQHSAEAENGIKARIWGGVLANIWHQARWAS
jgi:hypothetical protein